MSRGPCSASDQERARCPLKKPYSDVHHAYYPRSEYTTPVEKEFRELPINKEQLCRCVHNAIHALEIAPEKPNRQDMIQAIAQSAIEGEHGTAA